MKTKLEKFTRNDFEDYFQLVSDEKVMEMITERGILLEEAKLRFQRLIENNKLNQNFGCFRILYAVSNEFIGLAKLEIKEKNSDEAELGYMILPSYWGNGISSAVARRLIETAKFQKSIDKILAIINPKNIASRKILTNNGFVSKSFKDFDGLRGEILELSLN